MKEKILGIHPEVAPRFSWKAKTPSLNATVLESNLDLSFYSCSIPAPICQLELTCSHFMYLSLFNRFIFSRTGLTLDSFVEPLCSLRNRHDHVADDVDGTGTILQTSSMFITPSLCCPKSLHLPKNTLQITMIIHLP